MSCIVFLSSRIDNKGNETSQICGLPFGHRGDHGSPVDAPAPTIPSAPVHALAFDSLRWRTQGKALGFDLGKMTRQAR